MGTGNIDLIVDATTADASDVNQFGSALKGDLVPRNSSGVVEANAGECGTLSYPWASGRFTSLIVNGQAIDPDLITTKANRVASGRTRTNSSQVDFLRASGAGATGTILATSTNLVFSIKGTSYTLSADLGLTGLTLAPTTNNTCLVNDTAMTGATADKYVGEGDTTLTIDTAGTEITALIGQMIALKGTTEILFGYLKSATELTNCYRGFYFDSAGAPIVREALADNDTLTLMKIGWVFLQSDLATYDVSYTTPVFAYSAPSSPATGDYWLDQINQIWKRWSGSAWADVDRTLLGMVVMDGTNCIATRSLDPYFSYSESNTFALTYLSATQIQTKDIRGEISIYGVELDHDLSHLVFDITTDLESGFTEAASTTYYAYLSGTGQKILSPERPYLRPDLKGRYHPYHSWRYVGEQYNNAAGDFFTDEINTGELFIDGKYIYKMTKAITVPNTGPTSASVAHGTTIETLIKFEGAQYYTTGAIWWPLPAVDSVAFLNQIKIWVDATYIWVNTGGNGIGGPAYITIYYTKP